MQHRKIEGGIMRIAMTLVAFCIGATSAIADPVISSFHGNGILTVTNAVPGRRYSVQWKPSLTAQEWVNTWQALNQIEAENDQLVFAVPMFFRVLEDVDTIPPANISDLTVYPSDQMVELSWTNPMDPDFAGVVVVRSTSKTPNSPNDGAIVFDGLESSFADISVENGTPYYYRVFARDSAVNYASGVVACAVPQASLTTVTVTETFSDVNGQNNLVDTRYTTAYYDETVERYYAATPGVINNTTVVVSSPGQTAHLVKSFVLSGHVARVSNQVGFGSSGNVWCYVNFLFSDGSNFQTPSQSYTQTTAVNTYANPYFTTRLVTKIQVFLRSDLATSSVWEKNTVSSPIYSSPVVVEVFNPHSGGTIIQTWLDVASVRETDDIISYELTDGITTNRFNNLATWYPVTNALTNPTKIRVLLRPATVNLTEGGTGLISVNFKMRKR